VDEDELELTVNILVDLEHRDDVPILGAVFLVDEGEEAFAASLYWLWLNRVGLV
jgi:hypothetical protein